MGLRLAADTLCDVHYDDDDDDGDNDDDVVDVVGDNSGKKKPNDEMDVSTCKSKTRRDYNLKFHRVEGCTAWSCAASCRGNELPTVAAEGGGVVMEIL
ncbi:hypothetical protein V1478_003554 [Vespula squamosa]|uniref:Uncharacterized protein n=1 Tax=Vespula squamosa TaxID=30214 RepID=A0ABD2BM43_VESSQ